MHSTLLDHVRNAADHSDHAPEAIRWYLSATLSSLATYLAHDGAAASESLAGRLDALAEAVRRE